MINFKFIFITEDNYISKTDIQAASLEDAKDEFFKYQIDRLTEYSVQITNIFIVINCQLIDLTNDKKFVKAKQLAQIAYQNYTKIFIL